MNEILIFAAGFLIGCFLGGHIWVRLVVRRLKEWDERYAIKYVSDSDELQREKS